jgi:U3 small nucleolar RNA-associated protein 13
LATGEKLQQLSEEDVDTNEVVTCFCMHPNGDEVVVSTMNFLLRHYKLSDKSCERVIKGHTMPVLAMAYDPTGTLIATGSADRTVRVWDVARGYCTHNFRDHTDIIQSVYFHPDPNRLLLFSCSEDKSIMIFDLIDNVSVACFKDHMSLPTGIALSPDGYIMASAGRDKVTTELP